MEDKEEIKNEIKEEIKEEKKEINEININNEKLENKNENNKNEIESILEKIKNDFKDRNYQKVEENCKIIFEDKNIENLENINKDVNIIELLNIYAISFYNQMKYELASKILFKIIVNYDNKNKEAYLLFIRILYDINEFQKANLLLEKVNKILDVKDLDEFNEIQKEIENKIEIKNNNIKRQYYYNAQKDIFNLRRQLHYFYYIFYSMFALFIGNYLYKLLLK